MSISTVATHMGFPLDQQARSYIRSEVSIRRNELWAQGLHTYEDDLIEEVIAVLFSFDSGSTISGDAEV